MLDENARDLADLAVSRLGKLKPRPTVAEIEARVLRYNAGFELPKDSLAAVIAEVETRISTTMERGEAVLGKGGQLRWLAQRRDKIDFAFWKRYEKYLEYDLGFSPAVTKVMDSTLDDLLELLGDPDDTSPYLRRGLIVGDVQSGKTATCIGLSAKAADAGFKIIILLAGHINTLRIQTQERFDEGLAGRDSRLIGKIGGESAPFGAARYGKDLIVHEYTTKLYDFNIQAAQTAGSPLAGLRGPALLIIKKNKTILNNLYLWLRSLNPVEMGKIKSSLLLIDDEADFASVNTGPEYDPRAINKGIRQLLQLFDKASYVGVTATPFANVFIAPDSRTEMLGENLFPEDYIYSLQPPSNYIGANQVFGDELDLIIRKFDDLEPIIPLKHNTALQVTGLSASLIRALYVFVISNAIRDLRGDGTSHRSMLVNVSPANAVQAQVAALLREVMTDTLKELQVFAGLPSLDAAKESERIRSLELVFGDEYAENVSSEGIGWDTVLRSLYEANRLVEVKTINMSSAGRLDYDQHKEDGLRCVAVGGHSLSRGLTLEGLCVSYFHRNSKAYDTLFQMGRWFGYRPNYRDLCRIYMTKEAVANYQFISDAVNDLKLQFARMREVSATPADFGLKVRASPAGLMMTAASKMKEAKKMMFGMVSLSNRRLDATQLDTSGEVLLKNESAVQRLLEQLPTPVVEEGGPRLLWRDVPKELIAELLDQYRVHQTVLPFRPAELAHYLTNSSSPKLDLWDVCIREGSDVQREIHGISLRASRRTLSLSSEARAMFNIGEEGSRRLGSSDDDMIALDSEQKRHVEDKLKARIAGDKNMRRGFQSRLIRPKPLLILYMIAAEDKDPANYVPPVNPFTAISISFPEFVDDDLPESEIVLANPVWQRYQEALSADVDDDDRAMNNE